MWAGAVALAVGMGLLPTLLAAPAHAEDASELTAEQKVLLQAKESGERVELTAQRSERTTVFANPDGHTFTQEESAVPVRVAKDGGGWQAPDATLEVRSDGSVAPRAAAVDMEFSGGGADAPWSRSPTRAVPWPSAGREGCPRRSSTARARSTARCCRASTSR